MTLGSCEFKICRECSKCTLFILNILVLLPPFQVGDKVDFLILFCWAVAIATHDTCYNTSVSFLLTLVLNSSFLFYVWSWWPLKDLELWKFHWWKNIWDHILESLWLINLCLLVTAKFINLYIIIFFNCSTINFYGNFRVIYDRQKSLLEKEIMAQGFQFVDPLCLIVIVAGSSKD